MKKRRLTIEQAIQFINELKGVEGVEWASASMIYKYTSLRKLKNYGSRNKGLYDVEELRSIFGEEKSA